jgi:putative peptide maturation system protein
MAGLGEYVALEVNGEEISFSEVLKLAKLTGQLQFIQDAVDAALIRQAATERGLNASDDELQRAADDFRIEHELHTAEATTNWLAEKRLTFEDWESLIELSLIRDKLRERIAAGKVEQHFVENRPAFDSAAISGLVVKDEDVARELRAQIVEDGADFYTLARQYSIDARTKPAGGYSGEVSRELMEAAVEAAVFGAPAGKIVGPFKTDDGWQLIKIESLHLATLTDALRETIKSLLFEEWLGERRRKARVGIPLFEEVEETEDEVDEESATVED